MTITLAPSNPAPPPSAEYLRERDERERRKRVKARALERGNVLPWHRPALIGWLIVGMNHYHINGAKRLYVAMTWQGRYLIKAEGADEPELWDDLVLQALATTSAPA